MALMNISRLKTRFLTKVAYFLLAVYLTFLIGYYSRIDVFLVNTARHFSKSLADVMDDESEPEELTIHCNEGRLGNQMCTLAVLLGLGNLNGRNISILPCNKKALDPYFEITAHEANTSSIVERNPHSVGSYLLSKDTKISRRTNIIKGYQYPCSFTFFNHIRADIKKVFSFREEFRKNAEQVLLDAKGNRTDATFVGVHVRRGDYVNNSMHAWLWAFEGREVDMEYFEKATKYFRDKYPSALFVVVSDDLEWCRENLNDYNMYIPDESLGPAYDMAILAQCNHTLMTYGTFGFWGAYLAGGDVVYFDKFLKPGTDFVKRNFLFEKMYLPEWVGIDTTRTGFWDTYVPLPLKGKETESFSAAKNKVVLEPLTILCNAGRLGNQMCTFAVLQGLGSLNRRRISTLPCNKKFLDSYFELSTPEVNISSFVEHNPYSIEPYLRSKDTKIPTRTNVIKGYKHPCSFTFFNHIRREITRTFLFREEFRQNAEHVLLTVKGNRTNVTFVGVHVRREDYVKKSVHAYPWLWAFNGREVDKEYFDKAAKYFREKYFNVLFVVVSDDLPWCKENLKKYDMYIPDRTLGPAHDMAILVHCNHTIMTYGTFGFWGAYLTGGDVVYFDKFLKPGTPFTKRTFIYEKMYLPEWIGIDTTKSGFWNTYVPLPRRNKRNRKAIPHLKLKHN